MANWPDQVCVPAAPGVHVHVRPCCTPVTVCMTLKVMRTIDMVDSKAQPIVQ